MYYKNSKNKEADQVDGQEFNNEDGLWEKIKICDLVKKYFPLNTPLLWPGEMNS